MVEPPTRQAGTSGALRGTKVDSEAGVFLVDLSARIRGQIVDVSLGGCRIRAAERFPVGILRLKF